MGVWEGVVVVGYYTVIILFPCKDIFYQPSFTLKPTPTQTSF